MKHRRTCSKMKCLYPGVPSLKVLYFLIDKMSKIISISADTDQFQGLTLWQVVSLLSDELGSPSPLFALIMQQQHGHHRSS